MIASWSLLYLLLLTTTLPGALLDSAQSSNIGARLSLEEVVKLSQAGVSEDVIITKIKKNGKGFDLSAEELVDLKKGRITDNIIRLLLHHSQPYTHPPPSPTQVGPDPSAK